MHNLHNIKKTFNYTNVHKDVEENLNNKLFKNMRKFVKKFFNKKERLLILQNNESYKSK
jgi:hypothetical protein